MTPVSTEPTAQALRRHFLFRPRGIPGVPWLLALRRGRQAPALITVFGPAGTPLALQRLIGNFVGADALAVRLHGFQAGIALRRCETRGRSARRELRHRRGGIEALERELPATQTQLETQRGTQTTGLPASGSCAERVSLPGVRISNTLCAKGRDADIGSFT
jgi:hypothetical protein